MTPEEQRSAIAEACGWRHEYIHGNGVDDYVWIDPQNIKAYSDGQTPFPDYLNDLNACHEMEKSLADTFQRRNYYQTLDEITGDQWNTIGATATQRCEAFLKTINLWKS